MEKVNINGIDYEVKCSDIKPEDIDMFQSIYEFNNEAARNIISAINGKEMPKGRNYLEL